jgi:hypothetical protein
LIISKQPKHIAGQKSSGLGSQSRYSFSPCKQILLDNLKAMPAENVKVKFNLKHFIKCLKIILSTKLLLPITKYVETTEQFYFGPQIKLLSCTFKFFFLCSFLQLLS